MQPGARPALGSGPGARQVTVVVCTYNRAPLLPDALRSLLGLDVPDGWQWHVLVVDNRSSDATAQVVADMMRATPDRLRYVLEPEPGVAAARNCGIARSSGDWIAFFDDDQIAEPAWLRELVEFALHNDVRVVGGGSRLSLPVPATDLPPEVHRLFSAVPHEQSLSGRAYTFGAGNVLFHRSVFEEVGVFDASLCEGGEDTDLTRRLRKAGIVVGHQSQAIVQHWIAPSRLETPALLAASYRVGWGFGRRDRRTYGTLGLVALCSARLLMLAFKGTFRYLRAMLAGDRRSLLGLRIDVARTRGYCAATAASILPKAITSRLNLGEPSFRDELGRTASQVNTGRV